MSLYIVQCGARTIFGVFLVLLCCNDCGYTKSTGKYSSINSLQRVREMAKSADFTFVLTFI